MEEKEREELSYLVDVGLKVSIFGMVITIFVDYISKDALWSAFGRFHLASFNNYSFHTQ